MDDVQPDATSTEVSQAPAPQVEESAPVAAASEAQPDAAEQSKPAQGKQSQSNQGGQNRQGQGKGPRPEGQRAQGGGERGPGGERRDNRPPKGQGGGPREGAGREGGNAAAREGGRGNDRGGDRAGDRGGNRGDRGHDRGGDRRPGGGGRPFEAMADIEIEKLISDSLYLDNQAHAVVSRMRDMDSGTKSQLRRLFNAVRRAVATPEKERQHEFVMLRARLAYTIARHSLRSLDGLERLLLQVTRKNEARGYERFKDLFEAIVAYNE